MGALLVGLVALTGPAKALQAFDRGDDSVRGCRFGAAIGHGELISLSFFSFRPAHAGGGAR